MNFSGHHVAKRFQFISLLFISSLALAACSGSSDSGSSNSLNIGFGTKGPDSVSIDLNGLMNYSGKSKDELLALRSKTASVHPELLKSAYTPSPSIFAVDGKNPWWSTKGYIFRGREGISSTDGLSRESASFGNPYLLVSAEWYGNNMAPNRGRFAKDLDFANVFPTYLPPASVKIFPKEQREEITYNVMSYYNDIKSMLDGNWPVSGLGFDLHTYNARDFGYNYIYIEPGNSSNINKYPPDVVAITEGVGTKTRDTCAPACNDLVDTPEALTGFRLKDLPAKCHLMLWRMKPASHLSPTDLTVDLEFK